MRNTMLNGFNQIRHSLSATGREIHPRAQFVLDRISLKSISQNLCF